MLVWFSRIFLYASLVTPLVYSSSFIVPFITPKVIWFQTFVSLALVIALFVKKAPFKGFSVVSGILCCFGASLVISSIFGVNTRYSFLGNYERSMGIFNLVYFYIFYFVAIQVFDKKSFKLFISFALAISCVVSILGIFQYLGWPYGSNFLLTVARGRVWTTLGNYLYASSYALFGVFLSLKLLIGGEKRLEMSFYSLCLVCNVVLLILGGSRGSMLGIVSGAFLLIFIYFIKGSRRTKINMISLFVFAVVFISLLGINNQNRRLNKIIPNLSHFFEITIKGTGEQRLIAWQSGWQAFKEKPLLGWGNENITIAFNKYYNPRTYELGGAYETNKDRFHNFYLDILVQQGLVGFLIFLGLICIVFYQLFLRKEYIFIGLWLGALVELLFLFPSQSEYLWLFIFLAYVSLL